MIKNNVLADFENRIEAIVEARPLPTLQDRYQIIERLNNEFFDVSDGQVLPPFMLSLLTDWILIEVLKDKDVDKVSNSEFAILSPRQLKRRDKRENSVLGEVLDYLDLRYKKHHGSLAKNTKKVSE